jgi:hypothetical protein
MLSRVMAANIRNGTTVTGMEVTNVPMMYPFWYWK